MKATVRARAVFAILLFLEAIPLSAQDAPEFGARLFPRVQLSYGNPGARSLGMGGAFLALADDASAAEANPAGLTILRRPEVSLELRDSSSTQDVPASGVFPNLATIELENDSDLMDVSFASFVVPRGQFAVGLYYHHFYSYNQSVLYSEPIDYFVGPGGAVSPEECAALGSACEPGAIVPEQDSFALDIHDFGVAGAWATEKLSIGAAIRYNRMEVELLSSGYSPDGALLGSIHQDDTGSDVTWNIGFKWTATPNVSVGGVYKTEPRRDVPVFYSPPGSGVSLEIETINYEAPDMWGLGIAIRPQPELTFSFDAARITYSDFLNDSEDLLGGNVEDYSVDDGTELHFGVEYFFATNTPFALRAGWWRDPAHQIRYEGPIDTADGIVASILYPGDEDEDHYSIGIGWAWPDFQLDAAWDHADSSDVVSLSIVARFR